MYQISGLVFFFLGNSYFLYVNGSGLTKHFILVENWNWRIEIKKGKDGIAHRMGQIGFRINLFFGCFFCQKSTEIVVI